MFSMKNLWNTVGKHRFSFGTFGKHYENTCFPWEPIKSMRKTQVFHGNLWKTLGKPYFPCETLENRRKNTGCSVGTYGTHNENTGVLWEPMENTIKTKVFRGNQL